MSKEIKSEHAVEFSDTGKIIHKCISCSYVSEYSSNINRHLSDYHFGSSQIPFYCRYCLHLCQTQLDLQKHMKTHEKEILKSKRGIATKRKAVLLKSEVEYNPPKYVIKTRRGVESDTKQMEKYFRQTDSVVYKGQIFDPSELLLKKSLDNQYVVEEPGPSKFNLDEVINNPVNKMLKYKVLKNTEFVKKSGVLFPVNSLSTPTMFQENDEQEEIDVKLFDKTNKNERQIKCSPRIISRPIRVIPQNIQPLDLEAALSKTDPVVKEQKVVPLRDMSLGIGKYKPEYEELHPGIQPSSRGSFYFYCSLCDVDVLLTTHGGSIQRHTLTMTHIDHARRRNIELPNKRLPTGHEVFKKEYSKMFPGITESPSGPNFFYCLYCNINRPLGYRGFDMIKRHAETNPHQQYLPEEYRKKEDLPKKKMIMKLARAPTEKSPIKILKKAIKKEADESIDEPTSFLNNSNLFSIVKIEPVEEEEEVEQEDFKDPSIKVYKQSAEQYNSSIKSCFSKAITDFALHEIKMEIDDDV